ncbi:MAG TPA: hypothetical protein VJL84_04685 [Kiloniellales bacterium]|nr:hypothetical protein [Kiloniellales bacterium]
MQPKLPADHPTTTPAFEPSPKDRRDLVEPRPPVDEERAIRDESAPPPVMERLAEDLAAAASPLVPEAGVAEGGPVVSERRNRVVLIVAIVLVVAALAVLLAIAT